MGITIHWICLFYITVKTYSRLHLHLPYISKFTANIIHFHDFLSEIEGAWRHLEIVIAYIFLCKLTLKILFIFTIFYLKIMGQNRLIYTKPFVFLSPNLWEFISFSWCSILGREIAMCPIQSVWFKTLQEHRSKKKKTVNCLF